MRGADPVKAFLGAGWAFPPGPAADGRIAMAEYEEDIRQSIRIILGTDRGERLMHPDFGAGLNQFVFEPTSSSTMHLVASRVTEALVAWEPRIEVVNVKVTADPLEHNKLLIELTYRVRVTNTQFNLVYPFYLEEGAAG